MASTTTITVNRRRLFCQTIKILNTISLNSNTITLFPSPFNKTISFTTINHDASVLDQTAIIYNTNPLHFLTLSLFFLPLTIITATLIFSYDVTTIIQQLHFPSAGVTINLQTLTILIAVIISTIIGVATITYSTYHTICHTPLTFTSTFKSLSSSFIPLFSTFIVATIVLPFILLIITLLGLGFRYDRIRITCGLVITVLFYVVTLGLASPIAVLESKSGFVTLRECVKNQSVMLWSKFFTLVINTVLANGGIFGYYVSIKNKESVSIWVLFVVVSVIYLQASLMMVHSVVSTVVLYVRAKAAHGGYVVVKTRMHVSREDRRVPFLGWFTHTMAIFYIIIIVVHLI